MWGPLFDGGPPTRCMSPPATAKKRSQGDCTTSEPVSPKDLCRPGQSEDHRPKPQGAITPVPTWRGRCAAFWAARPPPPRGRLRCDAGCLCPLPQRLEIKSLPHGCNVRDLVWSTSWARPSLGRSPRGAFFFPRITQFDRLFIPCYIVQSRTCRLL